MAHGLSVLGIRNLEGEFSVARAGAGYKLERGYPGAVLSGGEGVGHVGEGGGIHVCSHLVSGGPFEGNVVLEGYTCGGLFCAQLQGEHPGGCGLGRCALLRACTEGEQGGRCQDDCRFSVQQVHKTNENLRKIHKMYHIQKYSAGFLKRDFAKCESSHTKNASF